MRILLCQTYFKLSTWTMSGKRLTYPIWRLTLIYPSSYWQLYVPIWTIFGTYMRYSSMCTTAGEIFSTTSAIKLYLYRGLSGSFCPVTEKKVIIICIFCVEFDGWTCRNVSYTSYSKENILETLGLSLVVYQFHVAHTFLALHKYHQHVHIIKAPIT